MRSRLQDRLAARLVAGAIFFALALTVVVSLSQLFFEYRHGVADLEQQMRSVADRQLPKVTRSIAQGDDFSVLSILDELVGGDGIAYAAVVVDDRIQFEKGKLSGRKSLCNIYPMLTAYSRQGSGTALHLAADTETVLKNKSAMFLRLLVGNGLIIFLAGSFLFVLVQFLVTKPLESIAEQLRRTSPAEPFRPLQLLGRKDHKDELSQVVASFNNLQDNARQAYESLARNERRLLQFFDSTEEAILGVDSQANLTFANDAALRFFHKERLDELLNIKLSNLLPGSTPGCQWIEVLALVQATLHSGGKAKAESLQLTQTLEKQVCVSFRCYPVFKEGVVSGALLYFSDQTAASLLNKEKERLSAAISQVPLLVLVADQNLLINYTNPACSEVSGYAQAELIGLNLLQFCNLEDGLQESREDIVQLLQSGSRWQGLLTAQARDGRQLQLSVLLAPVRNDQGQVESIIGVYRDVSFELGLQEELIHSKKMEAVHRLADSFAHEFGNPLFGVQILLRDFRERQLVTGDDLRLLQLAETECAAMWDLLASFRQQYQTIDDERTDCLLEEMVGELITSLQDDARAGNVAIDMGLSNDLVAIRLTSDALILILEILMRNAIEATIGEGRISLNGWRDENMLLFTVSDFGSGIPIEFHHLIFEPFFSTKREIEGVGMGLSKALMIARSLGGTISFTSRPGEGSVFTLAVPLAGLQ